MESNDRWRYELSQHVQGRADPCAAGVLYEPPFLGDLISSNLANNGACSSTPGFFLLRSLLILTPDLTPKLLQACMWLQINHIKNWCAWLGRKKIGVLQKFRTLHMLELPPPPPPSIPGSHAYCYMHACSKLLWWCLLLQDISELTSSIYIPKGINVKSLNTEVNWSFVPSKHFRVSKKKSIILG